MERTTNLMNELNQMDDSVESFKKFQERHPNEMEYESLSSCLNMYIAKHPGMSTNKIIEKANISRDYAQQFFNGYKTHPGKYKLIAICIAMEMSVKETDRALFLAGQPRLNPKSDLDAALIICINRKFGNMIKVNEFLDSVGLDTI